MDNPEIQITLVTRNRTRTTTTNTTQRVKKMSNTGVETLEKTKRAAQHVQPRDTNNTSHKKQKEDNKITQKKTQHRVNNTCVNRGAREVDINIHLNIRLPFLSVTYS